MPFMLFMVIKNRGKTIELSISNPKDAARRFFIPMEFEWKGLIPDGMRMNAGDLISSQGVNQKRFTQIEKMFLKDL